MNVITYNEFESNHPNTISNLRLSLDFYNYKSFAALFTLFTILKIKKKIPVYSNIKYFEESLLVSISTRKVIE